jgi:N-acetylmuramate 1-kinase
MTKTPRRAMILAAGLGTRMAPLSADTPKAVMPLWGRSLLARQVDMLAAWGVREVLINLHHGAAQVFDEVCRLAVERHALRLAASFEPEILGTGGALRRAAWFFADDEPFWLVNADIVARVQPQPLQRAMVGGDQVLAALWMVPDCGPRSVTVDADGRVTDFAVAAGSGWTFSGLHLVRPAVLEFLPETGFGCVIAAYRRAMQAGWQVAGVTVPGSAWADVGTPERYLQAHWTERDAGRATGDVAASEGVVVDAGARVRHSVLWSGARVTARARVEDAVIGRGVIVRSTVRGGVVVAGRYGLEPAEAEALQRLGWRNVDDVTVHGLAARGSARSFWRVTQGVRRRAILVRYDGEREENRWYGKQARFLRRAGWPVPQALWDDAAAGRLLLEDVGDRTLPRQRVAYRRVLDAVVVLQGAVTRAFRRQQVPAAPPFGAATYAYERQLFCEELLRKRLGLSPAEIKPMAAELEQVAAYLEGLPAVLVHRDLQSSNVLWRRGQPVLIDFQGMRLGPAAYDVASLLYDPYVALSASMRQALVDDYVARARRGVFRRQDLDWAAVQRLCQALGAYARLAALPGCARFADYIPVAVRLLREPLARLPLGGALQRWAAEAVIRP